MATGLYLSVAIESDSLTRPLDTDIRDGDESGRYSHVV
jgi:hypothetical protein